MKIKFFKINGIAGNLYYTNENSKTVIIYALGAPRVPDEGNVKEALHVTQAGLHLFVPDYIGFGRSDGVFTPINCINTFLRLYKYFKKGILGINTYENLKREFKYERIIFVGKSFGGTYIPLLPRFNSEIKELGIFYPVVDSKSQGSEQGEETNELFLQSMDRDGYKYLYRGIMNKLWKDHLENLDDLSPILNISYLNNTKLFIAHGMLDKCVNYKKSEKYFKKVLNEFPNARNNFKLKLYKNSEHGYSTARLSIKDFIKWIL